MTHVSFHNQVLNSTFLTLYNESTSNEIDYIKSSKVVNKYLVYDHSYGESLKNIHRAHETNSKLKKQAKPPAISKASKTSRVQPSIRASHLKSQPTRLVKTSVLNKVSLPAKRERDQA